MSKRAAIAAGAGLALWALAQVAAAQGTAVDPAVQSTGYLAAKAIAALAMVLGVVVLLYWLLRRFSPGQVLGSTGPMRLLGRLPLGPRKWLALVEVGERVLVLGVADQNINLLAEIEDPDQKAGLAGQKAAGFAGFLRKKAGPIQAEEQE